MEHRGDLSQPASLNRRRDQAASLISCLHFLPDSCLSLDASVLARDTGKSMSPFIAPTTLSPCVWLRDRVQRKVNGVANHKAFRLVAGMNGEMLAYVTSRNSCID